MQRDVQGAACECLLFQWFEAVAVLAVEPFDRLRASERRGHHLRGGYFLSGSSL